MAQYIPKSAVEKILRNLWKEDDGHNAEHRICYNKALQEVQCEIDTLEVKEVDVWKTVDNINPQQADKNKIYCVFTKDRYILATVINHPKDEELLQWKCTEFPHHRYDMCEGDKYMQIV